MVHIPPRASSQYRNNAWVSNASPPLMPRTHRMDRIVAAWSLLISSTESSLHLASSTLLMEFKYREICWVTSLLLKGLASSRAHSYTRTPSFSDRSCSTHIPSESLE